MSTDKRARQKANRESRVAAAQATESRDRFRSRIITYGALAVLVVLVIVGISILSSDDEPSTSDIDPAATAPSDSTPLAIPEPGVVAPPPEKGVEMSWIWFVVGAVLSWGLYGPFLHKGQVALGNPLKAFLFVGVAYFLVGVLVPLASLASQGELKGFTAGGIGMSTFAGILGAVGAVCVIYSFRAGGTPLWVMPLVFAGAPIVNVLYSMWEHPPKTAPSPMLYVGFLMAAAGAYMVLHYKPQG